jgi:hypothetical protein
MGGLDRLPTEILCHILGELTISDVRRLRLVSRSIGTVANSVAWKELCFILRKNDFDLVRAIVNNPSCASHITSLAYVVDVLNLERQTLDMFRAAVRRDEHTDAQLHTLKPKLFDPPGPTATEAQQRRKQKSGKIILAMCVFTRNRTTFSPTTATSPCWKS